jgi:predicted HTH domain antitoxin
MQITISFSDKPFASEPKESVARKFRLYAAMGMYRAGELSIGAACELANVDRYTFIEFCKDQGITIQTQTPGELAAEFARLSGK